MNETPSNNPEKEQELIGSLLDALYETQSEKAQSLVSSGMRKVEEVGSMAKQAPKPSLPPTRRRSGWIAIAIATAAIVLIGVFIPNWNPSKSAIAAVNNCLQQAFVDVGRHYVITDVVQVNDQDITRNIDLYVKGRDQFAIKTKGPLGINTVWLGSQKGQGWVVPPIGPVLYGDRENLQSWLSTQEHISTPYLHLTTLLERLRRNYELEYGDDQQLMTSQGSQSCSHIVGQLTGDRGPKMPDRIELWVDAKTEVALKIYAQWTSNENEIGRTSVTVQWQEELELDDAFFAPNEHGGQGRKRLRFNLERGEQ